MDALLEQQLQEVLETVPHVRVAVLFGSHAQGKARVDSDVDLAVDAPVEALGTISARVSEAVGREVDVVRIAEASIPLLRELVRTGHVVYEGQAGAEATFRSRALALLETDGPWYDRMRDAWIDTVAQRGIHHGQ